MTGRERCAVRLPGLHRAVPSAPLDERSSVVPSTVGRPPTGRTAPRHPPRLSRGCRSGDRCARAWTRGGGCGRCSTSSTCPPCVGLLLGAGRSGPARRRATDGLVLARDGACRRTPPRSRSATSCCCGSTTPPSPPGRRWSARGAARLAVRLLPRAADAPPLRAGRGAGRGCAAATSRRTTCSRYGPSLATDRTRGTPGPRPLRRRQLLRPGSGAGRCAVVWLQTRQSRRALLVASNRGPLSFTERDDGTLDAEPRRRRTGHRSDRASATATTSSGSARRCPTATARRPGAPRAAGWTGTVTTPAAWRCGCSTSTRRRSTARTTRSRTRRCGSCTTCSSRCRPRRRSTPASAASGRPTGVQPGVRRGARRGGGRGREGAGAGLPPRPCCRGCCATCGPTCASRTSRTRRGRRRTTSGCCPTPSRARPCSACSAPTTPASTPRAGRSAFSSCCVAILGASEDKPTTRRSTSRRRAHHPLGDPPARRRRRDAARPRPARTTSRPAHRAARASSATGRRSCASTAPSCRRTSAAGCWPTASCCGAIPSGAARSCTSRRAYPSRHDLPDYREYTAQVQRLAAEIENEFGTDDWRPMCSHVTDDYARSLALYRVGDVLLCNPVRDGMNLVAKEVPAAVRATAAPSCCRPRPA